ncbi:hypothetical protein MRX96_046767 [Rhipicephalus microplus]
MRPGTSWAAVRRLYSFTLSDGWQNHLAHGGGGARCLVPYRITSAPGWGLDDGGPTGGLLWRQLTGAAPQRTDRQNS